MHLTPKRYSGVLALVVLLLFAVTAQAQVGVFSREEIIEFTPEWTGERFDNGRPRVSDDILEKMKDVRIEDAWSVTERHGYHFQFEANWTNSTDEPVLVGRALTAYYHPLRPDVNDIIMEEGKRDGRIGSPNSWIIDECVDGDVVVVDLFGKVEDGTFLGGTLANTIYAKTGGTGVVVNGGSRDLESVSDIPDFPVFTRGWDPSFLTDVMLMGINSPIRIGKTTVMPGDIVLAKKEGIIIIPAHLAEEVVNTSEIIRLRDQFGNERIREEVYTPGQIDNEWTDEIINDFKNWLKENGYELTQEKMDLLLEGRTW